MLVRMALVYKRKFWFLCLFLPLFLSGNSQTFTDKKKEVRSYHAGKMTSVEIDNKYGKVHVIQWQKDSVRIEAELSVSSNNLSRLEKTKNNIRFDFTATNYYITARTNFTSTGNQFLQEIRGLSGYIIPVAGSVEINYTVYCPVQLNLSIINKFGNIYIDDLEGELKISLSNGDLKINSHEGYSQIGINFGTGIINSLTDSKLTISYSDVRIRKAGKLNLDTKSSTLNIDNCDILRSASRRDKYFITSVQSLNASGFFTQYWVESMYNEADMQLKFGNLNIEKIKHNFNTLNITSEYADINIAIEKSAGYKADIFHHPDVNLIIPVYTFDKGSGVSTENPALRHVSYLTGNQGADKKIRIYAIQKCYVTVNEK